jgi:hypothetical protein
MSWISDHLRFRNTPLNARRALDVATGAPIPPKLSGPLSLWDKLFLAKDISNLITDKAMLEKLKSRKLWITVGFAALTTLLNALGVDQAFIAKLIGFGMTYVGAQGAVDVATAFVSAKS